MSSIWKGIRSIVNLNNSSKQYIKKVSDPIMIAKIFNEHYVNVGPNIEKKIHKVAKNIREYLSKININKTFFLSPATPQEIFDIISLFDTKKTNGPNSIPIYILKICNTLFSDKLTYIVNLVFKTGIFPDLCKLAKIIPIFKKDDPLLCVNYRPISLLLIFSKILEKLIHKRMYSFLGVNKLIYNKQFGFRSDHSTSRALINTTEFIKEKLDSGFHVG